MVPQGTKACVLYYDKNNDRIGVRFTDNRTEGLGLVFNKYNGKQNDCYVHARSFLKYYRIDYSQTRRLPLTKDEESGLYVIDLRDKCLK